jgi:hypothetical protein
MALLGLNNLGRVKMLAAVRVPICRHRKAALPFTPTDREIG